jgi:hypothetical protein
MCPFSLLKLNYFYFVLNHCHHQEVNEDEKISSLYDFNLSDSEKPSINSYAATYQASSSDIYKLIKLLNSTIINEK